MVIFFWGGGWGQISEKRANVRSRWSSSGRPGRQGAVTADLLARPGSRLARGGFIVPPSPTCDSRSRPSPARLLFTCAAFRLALTLPRITRRAGDVDSTSAPPSNFFLEKVRPWRGQPSDRGRLMNKTNSSPDLTLDLLSATICIQLTLHFSPFMRSTAITHNCCQISEITKSLYPSLIYYYALVAKVGASEYAARVCPSVMPLAS